MVLLARHCAPEILREVAPPLWSLSARGRAQAARLAEDVTRHAPVRIVTSPEPKARETGAIVGAALGVAVVACPGLREHERSGEPYFDDPSELRERIRTLFARPDELVFGTETAGSARARFRAALHEVLTEEPRHPQLVISHGTVISLAVAEANGVDGFAFWERFGLGDHLVLATADLKLREHVVLRVGA